MIATVIGTLLAMALVTLIPARFGVRQRKVLQPKTAQADNHSRWPDTYYQFERMSPDVPVGDRR